MTCLVGRGCKMIAITNSRMFSAAFAAFDEPLKTPTPTPTPSSPQTPNENETEFKTTEQAVIEGLTNVLANRKTKDVLFLAPKNSTEADVAANDVNQGDVGDCYFLSALGAVASKNPTFIKQHIQDNHDGSYTVQFYRKDNLWNVFGNHEPTESVTVTKSDFENADGSLKHAQAGDQVGNKREIWVAVYEAAYANLHKGDIDGGQAGNAFYEITGNDAGETQVNDAPPIDTSPFHGGPTNNFPPPPGASGMSLADLKTANDQGKAITLSIHGTFADALGLDKLEKLFGEDSYRDGKLFKDNGLVDHHVFILEDVAANGNLTIRNPWGGNDIVMTYDDLKTALNGSSSIWTINDGRDLPTLPEVQLKHVEKGGHTEGFGERSSVEATSAERQIHHK